MDWDHLRLVLAVARGGTLSAAGRALGVNQTTAARRLAAAERAFGGPLFARVDGRLVATDAGRLVATRAERMEAEVAAAARALEEASAEAAGPVRVTAVESLVVHLLVPLVPALRVRLPGVRPVFLSDEATLDLARREADIGLRLARPRDGALRARRLAEVAFAVYVAPGGPDAWLAYDDSRAHLPEAQWQAQAAGGAAPVMRCGSVAALAAGAARGLGRAVLPCYLGDGHPGLVRQGAPVVRRELWMALHPDLGAVPRVRATADVLAEALTAPDLRARLSGSAGGAAAVS